MEVNENLLAIDKKNCLYHLDESYDVEDGYDGICETKSVSRANQSANNDALNVKVQSNVANDVKFQRNNVNAVKLNDYVNVAKVPDVYTEPGGDNQMQNIDDYDDYSNQSVFVESAQKVDLCYDKNVKNRLKESTLYDMFDGVDNVFVATTESEVNKVDDD